MLHGALALLVVLCAPGLAQEDTDEPAEAMTAEMFQAEYNRLSEELQGLAARNAWTGVERFYQQLLQTGIQMEFDELVTGAHAARALGDTKAMRDRLDLARKAREERDVIEWLWDIDGAYGPVYLACDVDKKRQPRLEIEAKPFDPNQARSVEFAVARLEETCLFDGMLPAGSYTFGPHDFKVVPKLESIRIDMRSMIDPSIIQPSEKPEKTAKKKD